MKIGIIAGSFDIIHPGYMYMFKKSQEYCDHLLICLQTDPSIERPNKPRPILNWQERFSILSDSEF